MGSRLEANSSAVRKRIEKHRFEDEDGEEYEPSKFGGFTDYFRRKKIKLQNLDTERRSSKASNPQIFRGVVAHVNGYTQPSLNDLHALIVDYGGGFMQYLDGKTTVTHIIASNLTPKKKIEFRRYRIVKPAWVVDSVKAGKLLPWDSYRVLDEGVGQHVIGFDNGNIVSQATSQAVGYRDQSDASWYTGQIKTIAECLDKQKVGQDQAEPPFPDAQELYSRYGIQEEDIDELALSPSFGSNKNVSDAATMNTSNHVPNLQNEGLIKNETKDESQGRQIGEAILDDGSINPTVPRQAHELQDKTDTVRGNGDVSPTRKGILTAEEHNAIILADPKTWKSTVVNPGFLKQYYEESRLHHLSAWKAELKSKMQTLAAEKSSSQLSRQKRPPGARRYILHVDFDSFFAAVSLRKHPELVDKPVVVAHGGGSGSEIASCNYPARSHGVKNGMWMKTAQQLCPDLKVLPYEFKAYEEASKSFYEAVIDTGGIVQSVSIDEALVDVSLACLEAGGHSGRGVHEGSIWREQAKADEIANGLRDQIKYKTGCAVSVGIGGNILLAKVALRRAKPAGQYQIKPEEVLDFLGGLTVQDLPGVAYSIGGKLEEIGVKFVRDILELSKERLVNTLGPKTGEKIWDYARGIDRAEVGDQVVRKSVSAEVNWGVRFATQEQADEFVQCLCEELHKRLVNEGVKGRQLTMKIMRRAADSPLEPPKHLGHGKCDTFNKSVVLGVATNAKEVLGREALSIMHGWGFPPGELRGIGVQMTKLEPIKPISDLGIDSSQKRLSFKKLAGSATSKLPEDPIIDITDPIKPKDTLIDDPIIIETSETSESQNLLNTLGTQFVMPTQVDPQVLAELPADIRSKLLTKRETAPAGTSRPHTPVAAPSRSDSPANLSSTVPSASQLDPETLAALPPDLRNEVLAFYHKPSPSKRPAQALLPQSPRKVRSIKLQSKKITPTKKRTGLLSRGRLNKGEANSTLTQSNFVATSRNNGGGAADSIADEIAPDILAALPEDIRAEVLAQQKRERLKKRSGLDLARRKNRPPQRRGALPARRLRLPQRPPRPTFTSKKLSSLPELRDAVSAWFETFADEPPEDEDVEALVGYLKRVVLEEKDMVKAVGVVKWLKWVVEEGNGINAWAGAVELIEDGVQEAVKARGLGRVEF